jgi:hypothetical protein
MNMKRYKSSLAVSIVIVFLCLGIFTSRDDATAAGQEPNLFELKGPGLEITYSTSSISGQPLFTYQDKKVSLTFQGEEIRRLEADTGSQVTVTLEQIPDLRTVTLTLLLPTINLEGTECPFQTQAIITTHKTSIGGPDLVKGVLQTYRIKALRGIARLVVF